MDNEKKPIKKNLLEKDLLISPAGTGKPFSLTKFHITENGLLMDGTERISIPECYVMASSYMEAVNILNDFLNTKFLTENIQLVTPIERIAFENAN
ncbi:hypothetical protein [Chryseobacterium sp. 5_R23647]|uniref:hypothetical protein n=1 Tax=Chryseobacterium sp. 5_R23647 TaxID=2258964 RepID=UPI000E264D71|nr:hypothetical protein [Chryseobacterium sp. 5_R23647]REC40514.1 hypothetical protein DRF69_18645 [Chryseobacterium sp. 5_R23647]